MRANSTGLWLGIASALLASCTTLAPVADPEQTRTAVIAVETAFAKTMADRDFTAFASFVSEEAVFLNGGKPLRGKAAVLAHWQKFFVAAKAPFSWKHDIVVVLPSGTLAQSTGPVLSADAVHIADFNSIWRLEAPGVWRIVFDNGSEVCPKP